MTDIAPPTRRYDYERDGRAIYRESFATIRREVTLDHLPEGVHRAAVRVAHAAGDVGVIDEIAGSTDVGEAALAALRAGAPVITDSHMLAAGVTRSRLPADNDVICTLREPQVPALAQAWSTTRSAAAASLWAPHLDGAVVAIGNAPTALFHLLEMLLDGAPRPAAIVGMPVGFVGSAESKVALAEHRLDDGSQIPWLTVHGRRGGSAMAAAAVNALATEQEIL
ncbi:precorrin-8X methylmutase [Dermacoccus nishinomiyaensis]|uniref:Precorrin-8X methylmutase n=1 Tax=Dermacoccus nishinomiyaensis TaxID=1274 RepID=A0A075JG58_9MICO|nr:MULTISPECIES: precorrin-8X methylmutase [Dermacoccus]AIF40879.1 precorrin-8X methylmutase [Dermacoccus nishinomiyaensis]MBO1757293.1 precorrin-8X methylmutase [Dermacoccus sp. NHGro5]NHC30540.1 precorrin-8X methylmutase [Dermacoccus nishinomiyaensis]PZP00180.1 MAG: precorrin-8X methylmutase [Dermacoccus nishinomiyaensis]QQY23657.1 precorrin-8X methylmutase [Dermacoccus nishinomiyaensis]